MSLPPSSSLIPSRLLNLIGPFQGQYIPCKGHNLGQQLFDQIRLNQYISQRTKLRNYSFPDIPLDVQIRNLVQHSNSFKNKKTSAYAEKRVILAYLRGKCVEKADIEASKMKKQGFNISKMNGNTLARCAFIGKPSVGKSTFLERMTAAKSKVAAYSFTTLTAIPGIVLYNKAPIQLVDLPGLIEGSSLGQKQRHILSVARKMDVLILMIDSSSDFAKEQQLLRNELENAQISEKKPQISWTPTIEGGVQLTSSVVLTHITLSMCRTVLKYFGIYNADINCHEDVTIDQLIQVIQGCHVYIPIFTLFTRIDTVTIPRIDYLARLDPQWSWVISVHKNLGIQQFLEKLWKILGYFRVYIKPKTERPDFDHPTYLSKRFNTVGDLLEGNQYSIKDFRFAKIFGTSVKFMGLRVGKNHILHDEDVVVIY